MQLQGGFLCRRFRLSFPAFEAPPWLLKAFIVLVIAGFPVTLLIGWFAAPRVQVDDAAPGSISNREMVLLSLLGGVPAAFSRRVRLCHRPFTAGCETGRERGSAGLHRRVAPS